MSRRRSRAPAPPGPGVWPERHTVTAVGRLGHDRRKVAFWAASCSLVVTFAASSSPIPLFNTYRIDNGLSTADIAHATVAYFLTTIAALLCLGRLANHLGRRPAAVISLSLVLTGAVVLMDVAGAGQLIAGRAFMGLGAGLASSALTSYIVDAAPEHPEWLAPVAASQAPMLGLTLGALISGSLVEYGPAPRVAVYAVMVAALAVCAALVLRAPETGRRRPGVWASLKPQVAVPVAVRHRLPAVGAVLLGTWALGAFYQAFVPAIVAGQLHTRNAVVVAVVFAAYMAPSVLGAPLGGRVAAATAQRFGMLVFLIGVAGILVSLTAGFIAGFLVASVVAGAGQGTAVSASIRGLLTGASLVQRAPLMAAVYLISYGSAMIPSIIAGQLSHRYDLVRIALAYGGLAVVTTLATLAWAREPERAG